MSDLQRWPPQVSVFTFTLAWFVQLLQLLCFKHLPTSVATIYWYHPSDIGQPVAGWECACLVQPQGSSVMCTAPHHVWAKRACFAILGVNLWWGGSVHQSLVMCTAPLHVWAKHTLLKLCSVIHVCHCNHISLELHVLPVQQLKVGLTS